MSAETNAAFEPPAPMFFCSQCRTNFTHTDLLTPLTLANVAQAAHQTQIGKTITTNRQSNIPCHTTTETAVVAPPAAVAPQTTPTVHPQPNAQESWADQMERLSQEHAADTLDTNFLLDTNTPSVISALHKRIDQTNAIVAQLVTAMAKNVKLVKENAKLVKESAGLHA